jgi:cobalt/nickel transport system permease protein
MLKFWTLFILTVASVASRGVGTGFLLGAVLPVLAVSWGGLRIHQYARLLVLPVSFLLLGGMALLWEVSAQPMGILSLPVGGAWLCVTPQGQARTVLVICRALGAVSCLCLLSVTTPMPEIIGVLRRARCPALVVDLMYLVYRYIFILLSLYHDMRDAAKSRLGFRDLRTSLRAGGKIYANVLARSYQWAGKNFDAMESRCYDAGIRFLERPGAVTWPQVSGAVVLVLGSWGLGLLPLGLPV